MTDLETFLRKQLVKAKRGKDVRRSWDVMDGEGSTVAWRQWIIKRAKPVTMTTGKMPTPSFVEDNTCFANAFRVADEHHTCRIVHGYLADTNSETKKVEAIPHAWNVLDGKHFDVSVAEKRDRVAIYVLTDDDVRDWLQNANYGWYVPRVFLRENVVTF